MEICSRCKGGTAVGFFIGKIYVRDKRAKKKRSVQPHTREIALGSGLRRKSK